MRPWIVAMGLAASAAATLALAPSAYASCSDDKTTGTILGGVGGALIGNSLARGGGGAILGGVGGALIGRSIAGSRCRHVHYAYGPYGPARYGPPPPPIPAAPIYYDQYGAPMTPAGPPVTPAAYAPACHTEMRAYYDDSGVLVRTPTQVCTR